MATMPKGKKPAAMKKVAAGEMKVEGRDEDGQKLPPADRKKFAAMHKAEMKKMK